MMFSTKIKHMLIFLFFLAIICPSVSFAHKVMVFGWVEGDEIKTISKFSGGKKVQNGPLSVYNKEGKLLIEGKTDEKGEFSFKRPDEKELKIVLEATMGHKTSCILEVVPDEEPQAEHSDESSSQSEKNVEIKSIDAEEVEAAVEKVLDKKMAVVLKMIAEKDEKQSVSEIISGIGYILGLIGIALWVRNR